ncbi:uncharacterized protein K441DRAFT_661864 [Cenococcum geophilum 1.58]|uniref:uncharacterized protein n=1 Tax=Cenococcum geophilum 1.58 TaxID=794803 RepID=UPI00358E691B|nr:hypothetical protein K441DRAFT_661864 [Cenococcum geophilum 1.58]
MRISVTAAALSKLFLVYVSHNIEHTILDTLLTLKNVSVREIELIQGIPTNISVSASYDYKPNQEIRLKFSNTNGEFDSTPSRCFYYHIQIRTTS